MVWPASKSRSTLQPQLLLFLYATGCFLLFMSCSALAAAPFSFSFDFSSTSNYRLDDLRFEGDAALNGDLVDLTCKTLSQSIGSNCTGRMSYNHPVRFYDTATGEVASFSTRFTFVIKPNKGGGIQGDGMAFFLSGYPSKLPLGSGGGNLGLDDGKAALGANRYVAVEFDTYRNTWDPMGTNDHIGIDINTVRSSVNTTSLSSSSLNGTMTATVSFESTTKMLIASLQFDDRSSLGPAQVSMQLPDDITSLLPSEVAVGFSAATSIPFELHQIMSWSFSSTLAMPQKTKGTNGTTETPGANNPQQQQGPPAPSGKGSSASARVIIGGAILLVPAVWFIVSWFMWKRAGNSFVRRAGLREFRRFEYRELSEATCNFSPKNKIGEGTFGVVYKGFLKKHKGKPDEVAVKQIKESALGEANDFISELNASSKTRHKNLVTLKGWCCSRIKWKLFDFMFCKQQQNTDLFLVYELVPNGSLHDHLRQDIPNQTVLPWETRYEIVKGIGEGLCYLHHDCKPYILHRDIKPCNILLEADFNPKLADFGLSRVANTNNTIPSTRSVGTEGYIDPLLRKNGKVKFRPSSDVYSFGVVLIDIACPQKTIDQVREMYRQIGPDKEFFKDAVDDKLGAHYDKMQMKQVVVLGLWCCFPDADQRPSMKEAMKVLANDAPLLNKGIWILKHGMMALPDKQKIKKEGGDEASSMTSPDWQGQPLIPSTTYERSV